MRAYVRAKFKVGFTRRSSCLTTFTHTHTEPHRALPSVLRLSLKFNIGLPWRGSPGGTWTRIPLSCTGLNTRVMGAVCRWGGEQCPANPVFTQAQRPSVLLFTPTLADPLCLLIQSSRVGEVQRGPALPWTAQVTFPACPAGSTEGN